MQRWGRLGRALPYLGAFGIVALSVMLVATIFLTDTRLPWQAFLAGALGAATLAFASRVSTNAWTIGRLTAELEAALARLTSETVLRTRAEKSLESITSRSDLSTTAAAVPTSGEPVADGQAIYADTLAAELTKWEDVADRLVCALKDDEFLLYAQDIVRLDPGAPPHTFREVLLRLQEEEDNLVPPGAFIPLAEKHGLMPEVDRWVLRHLMDWAAADATRSAATYSINVSVAALLDPGFVEFVHERLAQCGGAGPEICIEFSEHEGSLALDAAAALMSRLKPVGCRFALSGFGRAPVSFALLKRLPVDYMKIDAGAIVGMTRNEVDFAKVKAIARVARSLGIATIAECVEDEATLLALRSLGVDYAQGFAISRPSPLEQRAASSSGPALAQPAAAA